MSLSVTLSFLHVVMKAFFSLSTREALEFAGMSINFRSSKFGYSICPIFSKGHAEIFREFEHDFAKNRTYGVLVTNAWAGVS